MAQTDSSDPLSLRLERLERQLKLWKTLSAIVGIAVFTLAGMVIVAFRSGTRNASRGQPVTGELVGRKFVLLGPDSKTAATLEATNTGSSLVLKSPKGLSAELTVEDPHMPFPGQAGLQLSGALPDDKFRSLVLLSASPQGRFDLELGPPSAIDIGGTGDGDVSVALSENGGFSRAALSLDSKGQPSLSLSAKEGLEPRADLSLDEKDRPSLTLYDSDFKTRAVLGNASLENSKTGSTEETGPSSLVLFDKEGHVTWHAP